jgi:hypothetical protein
MWGTNGQFHAFFCVKKRREVIYDDQSLLRLDKEPSMFHFYLLLFTYLPGPKLEAEFRWQLERDNKLPSIKDGSGTIISPFRDAGTIIGPFVTYVYF